MHESKYFLLLGSEDDTRLLELIVSSGSWRIPEHMVRRVQIHTQRHALNPKIVKEYSFTTI